MGEEMNCEIVELLDKVTDKLTDITTIMEIVRYGKSSNKVLKISRKYGEDMGECFVMEKREVNLLLNNIEKLKGLG